MLMFQMASDSFDDKSDALSFSLVCVRNHVTGFCGCDRGNDRSARPVSARRRRLKLQVCHTGGSILSSLSLESGQCCSRGNICRRTMRRLLTARQVVEPSDACFQSWRTRACLLESASDGQFCLLGHLTRGLVVTDNETLTLAFSQFWFCLFLFGS